MEKISNIENNLEEYLNNDNLFGRFYLYDGILSEMSRFDKIPDTTFEIHVESGEGYVPHIHICKKSGKNVVMRIKLLTNEYLREKDDRKNVMNSAERAVLDKYLRDMYNEEYKITNWEQLCMQWSKFNPAHKITGLKNLKQPDYTTLKEPK